jgi:hypothetical protein
LDFLKYNIYFIWNKGEVQLTAIDMNQPGRVRRDAPICFCLFSNEGAVNEWGIVFRLSIGTGPIGRVSNDDIPA